MNDTISYDVNYPNLLAVNQLEEFQFVCCPECPDQSSTKSIFINHALIEHPKVNLFY
jgi:hypothetical protein